MTLNLINDRDEFLKKTPERIVTLNGRRWGVLSAGHEGPSLLLIPGTLGRAGIFWQQIERLSNRARILAVSYPSNHSIDAWAGDLARLLDRSDIERTTVLGSSLGGYLAQYFTAKYPDRVEGLIAANTLASIAGFDEKPPYSLDIAKIPIKLIRQGFLAAMKARARPEPEYQAQMRMLMNEVEGGIPTRHLKARLMALKYAPLIPAIDIGSKRIAVIEAEDDPLIPQSIRDGVRESLSPSVTYRFKEGGHFPYVVRPDAYLSILEERLGLEITGEDWGQGEVRSL